MPKRVGANSFIRNDRLGPLPLSAGHVRHNSCHYLRRLGSDLRVFEHGEQSIRIIGMSTSIAISRCWPYRARSRIFKTGRRRRQLYEVAAPSKCLFAAIFYS